MLCTTCIHSTVMLPLKTWNSLPFCTTQVYSNRLWHHYAVCAPFRNYRPVYCTLEPVEVLWLPRNTLTVISWNSSVDNIVATARNQAFYFSTVQTFFLLLGLQASIGVTHSSSIATHSYPYLGEQYVVVHCASSSIHVVSLKKTERRW